MKPALPRGAGLLAALALGAISVFGFAPFHLAALPVLTVALLFVLWEQSPGPRAAAALGFAYGLGSFTAGTSWIYISLHTFGGMPAELTAVATLLFCAVVACYPAFAGWLSLRAVPKGAYGERSALRLLAAMPACWTIAEILRAYLFTGFPWLELGYSQIPYGPLAGYASLLGSHGVTLAAAACAGAAGLAIERLPARSPRPVALPLAMIAFVVAMGAGLTIPAWTAPFGAPLKVALLQGNVAQERKFSPDTLPVIFDQYRAMIESSEARLIILPETAFPTFLHRIDDGYLAALTATAKHNGGDILFGVAIADPIARAYFNSVVSVGVSPPQTYRKYHLVPFGEYLPLRPLFAWVLDVLQIPMADFTPGPGNPLPMAVAGQQLALGICYEDAFGALMLRQLPAATLLVNVSNDAWFGESVAAEQHWQIAQMRAAETGRMMLRANNTGITGIIDFDGRTVSRLAPFVVGTVTGEVQGRSGSTPYARWGESAIVVLSLLMAAGAAILCRRSNGRG
ncbi:MAG: apolipoprotein N-acyltransferase [Betaproteobacteria bacterium]